MKEAPDRRGRQGRQIPLPAILSLSVAAMLAGADSLIAIFRWGRRPFASLPDLALALIAGTGLSTPAAREIFAEDRDATLKAVTATILRMTLPRRGGIH